MSQARFEHLFSRWLDEKLTAEEWSELVELIRENPALQDEVQLQLQAAELLAQLEDELHRSQFVSILQSRLSGDRFVLSTLSAIDGVGEQEAVSARDPDGRRVLPRSRWSWLLVTTAAVVLLIGSLFWLWPEPESVPSSGTIARITEISGPVQWTGNGGRMVSDLAVGRKLSGGTIESLAPSSWVELKLNDGSTITLTGNSILTLSDDGQKELYLRSGSFSAHVSPQPAGRPMLVHTQSATLEVLGTQFEVETRLSTTILNVTEGAVRVKRRSDGKTVEVPASHHVTATADRAMVPTPVSEPVHHWKSELHRGHHGTYGEWVPRMEDGSAELAAIPYVTEQGKTIYATGLVVSCCAKPPVVLLPNSRIRVQGRLTSKHGVWFGITVRQRNGDFAGRFQTIRPASDFRDGETFDVILSLRDFHLDPSLNHVKHKLPGAPYHLVVEHAWCHTLYDPAGLKITEVELIAPEKAEKD